MIPQFAPAVWSPEYVAIDVGFVVALAFAAAVTSLLCSADPQPIEQGADDCSDVGGLHTETDIAGAKRNHG